MVSLMNLIKCMIIFALLLCCQIHASPINDDNNDMNIGDVGDFFRALSPDQPNHFYRQELKRASLRYHPHVLYKKASLKPIIGLNGKIVSNRRDSD